jgi:translation initiation factor 5A
MDRTNIEQFEAVDAGASYTVPIAAGHLKKGDYVCIQDHPCKIADITTCLTGKRGHTKANIIGFDIFTGKRFEEVAPTNQNLPSPVVKTTQYQLIDISEEGQLTLLGHEGTREDMNLPLDASVATELKAAFTSGVNVNVVVTSAMGADQVLSFVLPEEELLCAGQHHHPWAHEGHVHRPIF